MNATIEHPTDVEDAARGDDDDHSDFDHLNNSPDIKLKSIEIDDDFQGGKNRNEDNLSDQFADDHSGTGGCNPTTGPNKKVSQVARNSYGSSQSTR